MRGVRWAFVVALGCGPKVAPEPPPPEPRETPPPVAEPAGPADAAAPSVPAAQLARRKREDEILAELEKRQAPLMQVPWKPIALERSTKWAGVQWVRFEPAYDPTNIGPLVIATFTVELRGSDKGVEAVFQGLSIEAQPGEVRELSVTRDPSDGMFLCKMRVILYARDPEMRGADEARLEEAWKRAQALTSGIRARGWLAAAGALGGATLEALEQHDGQVSYTISAREADGEALAKRLAASPELTDVRMAGAVAEGKGKAKRTRVVIEAKLK